MKPSGSERLPIEKKKVMNNDANNSCDAYSQDNLQCDGMNGLAIAKQ